MPLCFRGIEGAVVVYGVDDDDSFYSANRWIYELEQNTDVMPPFIICGNKCDLKRHNYISERDAERFAMHYNCPFFLTSAKDGTNINKAFAKLCDMMIKARFVFLKNEFIFLICNFMFVFHSKLKKLDNQTIQVET